MRWFLSSYSEHFPMSAGKTGLKCYSMHRQSMIAKAQNLLYECGQLQLPQPPNCIRSSVGMVCQMKNETDAEKSSTASISTTIEAGDIVLASQHDGARSLSRRFES